MYSRIRVAMAPAIKRIGTRVRAGSTGRTMRSFTDGAGTDGTGATGADAGAGLVAGALAVRAEGVTVLVLAAIAADFMRDGGGGAGSAGMGGRPQAPLVRLRMISLKGAGSDVAPEGERWRVRDWRRTVARSWTSR